MCIRDRDDTNEISHVFLALDLTEETLAEAIEDGADMIITHHPMIFSGIKKINNHSFTGRKIDVYKRQANTWLPAISFGSNPSASI